MKTIETPAIKTLIVQWSRISPAEIVTIHAESAKAFKLQAPESPAAWIPKSALQFDTRPTYENCVTVRDWFKSKCRPFQQSALGF